MALGMIVALLAARLSMTSNAEQATDREKSNHQRNWNPGQMDPRFVPLQLCPSHVQSLTQRSGNDHLHSKCLTDSGPVPELGHNERSLIDWKAAYRKLVPSGRHQ